MLQVHLCLFGLVAKFDGWLKHSLLGCKYDLYCRLQPEPCNKCKLHLWSEIRAQQYWSERSSLGNLEPQPTLCYNTLFVHSHNLMLCHIRAPQVALVDIGGGHKSGQRASAMATCSFAFPGSPLHCTALLQSVYNQINSELYTGH